MSERPLWAPWRIEYVTSRKDGECAFCRSPRLDVDDPESPLIRGERCFALLNKYPYSSGHMMVAPYRHVPTLEELDDQELAELMQLARAGTRALAELMSPDGFNVGLNLGVDAGAGIAEHLHLHVVPRWRGDTNFMPALAGTQVLPQALTDTHAALRRVLAAAGQP